MKISDVRTILAGGTAGRNWLFVKVETSDGLVGYGESTLESREQTTETAILELKRYLIGKDATEIERHWQAMYRGSFWRGGLFYAAQFREWTNAYGISWAKA